MKAQSIGSTLVPCDLTPQVSELLLARVFVPFNNL